MPERTRGALRRRALILAVVPVMPACMPAAMSLPEPDPAPVMAGDSVGAVIRRAQAESWYVRLSTQDVTWEGRVFNAGAAGFTIDDTRVGYDDVLGIQRRSVRGSGTVPGAVIGGLTLGAFGLALTGLCESGGCGDTFTLIGAGAVTGGFLGMVAGKLLRPGEIRWIPVWRRTTARPPGIPPAALP